MNKPRLHTAENGRVSIDFEEYDSPQWFEAVSVLEKEQGFVRTGEALIGMDEGILPSFVKGGVSIAAGWDNWSGSYLLSESSEGDEVLKLLFTKLFG